MPKLDTNIKAEVQKKDFAKFVIGPLPTGFGHTLGNALRRTLLSSLPGAAVVQLRIAGVPHEFSTIPGVTEDTVQLMLNLKKINFKMEIKKPTVVTLNAKGPGEIKAADLSCPTGVEVVNKNEYLATLADKKTKLEMEILVEYGRGYQLPAANSGVGVLPIDANFSPVTRVNYQVESTRVGRVSNLDNLILEISTTGAITPKDALQQSAAILVEKFSLVASGMEIEHLPEEEKEKEEVKKQEKVEKAYLEEIGLPTRVVNILKKAGYETLNDLQGKTADDFREVKNIGPKTITLIMEKVKQG
ncbi:MAG: DNA-directed RNA polymerase subunit alpha [Candidatus Cloacimonetes bacterium]|nr:DNA-directed RNA polymerase subunit alpha [Candidatus Cloacimonadota bacterium]